MIFFLNSLGDLLVGVYASMCVCMKCDKSPSAGILSSANNDVLFISTLLLAFPFLLLLTNGRRSVKLVMHTDVKKSLP